MKKKKISIQIVEYIINCSTEAYKNVTVVQLAEKVGLDRFTLSRIFAKETGMSLCKFITRERLYRAVTLLQESQETSVTEVAEKLGFSTTSYFIRVFRAHFGVSPGRFRRQLEAEELHE